MDGLAARDAGEEENFGFSQEFSREEKEIAGELEGRKLIVFIPWEPENRESTACKRGSARLQDAPRSDCAVPSHGNPAVRRGNAFPWENGPFKRFSAFVSACIPSSRQPC